MKATLTIVVGLVLLFSASLLAASAAIAFQAYVEAREGLERKKQSDRTIAAIEDAVDKLPDFNFFKRKEPAQHAPPAPSAGRLARFIGR